MVVPSGFFMLVVPPFTLYDTLSSLRVEESSPLKIVPILLSLLSRFLIVIVLGYLFIPFGESEKTDLQAGQWENSVAVLPFDDLSPEKDQEWFCDGMTEQLITNLRKIQRLRVIGRASVMKYKNTDKTYSEIGDELGVSFILDGSIRKNKNNRKIQTT